jgi:hypothetical protein
MKASFVLSNGTTVNLDGDPTDIEGLLAHFRADGQSKAIVQKTVARRLPKDRSVTLVPEPGDGPSEMEIVNWLKEEGSAPWVDQILDSRDVTRRVLLPLYAAHKLAISGSGVTSGFISRVLAQLGVRISVPNASRELSGRAKRYVLANTVRRKGAAVNYKISRAGMAFLEQGRG